MGIGIADLNLTPSYIYATQYHISYGGPEPVCTQYRRYVLLMIALILSARAHAKGLVTIVDQYLHLLGIFTQFISIHQVAAHKLPAHSCCGF